MQRLIRKLVILSVLLAMPAAISFTGGSHARAAICCSVCEQNFEQCEANCPPELPHGCQICTTQLNICERNCNPGC